MCREQRPSERRRRCGGPRQKGPIHRRGARVVERGGALPLQCPKRVYSDAGCKELPMGHGLRVQRRFKDQDMATETTRALNRSAGSGTSEVESALSASIRQGLQ
ncbi:unnamed protein product [Prorocentrum cordatum]|uniref:Uncharacterized protein n=1 Tax=Prorocentrum cordatum TaxID=2364126 RepID=A0ABN9VUZ3_9DINO|nr:unnamed protein product [Polarella glacialis]